MEWQFLFFLVVFIIVEGLKPCIKIYTNNENYMCACNSTYCDEIEPLPQLKKNQYAVYQSVQDSERLKLSVKSFSSNIPAVEAHIIVNGSQTYQTLYGFGGALTDSTAINIQKLPKEGQDMLIQQYFGKNSIHYTIVRIPIGGTDFSVRAYSLDDTDGDVDLKHFSLQPEDFLYRKPYLRQAENISLFPIKLLACPWSAPAWMKSNHAVLKGYLKKEYYTVYANYIVKFFEEWSKNGLNFSFLSVQNEVQMNYMKKYLTNGMIWSMKNYTEYLGNNLGPAIHNAGLGNISILVYDDGREDVIPWMQFILADPKAAQYVSGTGIHSYNDSGSSPYNLDYIHNLKSFQNKFLMYTETCFMGQPELGSWKNAEFLIRDIITSLNHWNKGWVDWNMALDETGGPTWTGNYVDAPIIVSNNYQEFYKQPMFYAMGHFSRFLAPGSVRLGVKVHENFLATVFQTPNNQRVAVVYNNKRKKQTLKMIDNERGAFINLNVPVNSFMTIVY